MLQVLALRKVPDTEPQEFELRLRDLENTKRGYCFNTEYGTEPEVRALLKNGGMPQARIDTIFIRASSES